MYRSRSVGLWVGCLALPRQGSPVCRLLRLTTFRLDRPMRCIHRPVTLLSPPSLAFYSRPVSEQRVLPSSALEFFGLSAVSANERKRPLRVLPKLLYQPAVGRCTILLRRSRIYSSG